LESIFKWNTASAAKQTAQKLGFAEGTAFSYTQGVENTSEPQQSGRTGQAIYFLRFQIRMSNAGIQTKLFRKA
jgi:hypothetical protein